MFSSILGLLLGDSYGNWFLTGEDPITHIKQEYLDTYLDIFSSVLSWFFGRCYDIFYWYIFDEMFNTFSETGEKLISKFLDSFANQAPSFSAVTFYIGFIFCVFVFKKVVDLLK